MCRPAHSSTDLLLSQQLCLLRTEFPQLLSLLRTLMVKQGYFLSFSDKFILNEPDAEREKVALLHQQGSQQAELLREQGDQQFELLRQQQSQTAAGGATFTRRPESL